MIDAKKINQEAEARFMESADSMEEAVVWALVKAMNEELDRLHGKVDLAVRDWARLHSE